MNEASDAANEVMEAVRRALGRTHPLSEAPVPPAIDERITRLVHTDIGLPELFATTASRNKMTVISVPPDELATHLVAFLRNAKVSRIALPASRLLRNLRVVETLREAGFDAKTWDQMTLDEAYDVDCGVTDVWAAVAEVGALVIRSSAEHGRAISLMPPIHVAIVEPKNLMPDLVDLFARLPKDQNDKFVIITGPSKTADIEMNLVTGVHGPGVVQVFLLK